MDWLFGIAVYFVIWWITLFAVLPFGVHSQEEMGTVVPGSESGAPVRPYLAIKILANSVLAAIVWLVLDLLYIRYLRG